MERGPADGATDGTTTGTYPGAADAAFTDRCRRFLGLQIAVQRPRLVLSLGSHVPGMLAALAPGGLADWAGARSVAEFDAAGVAVMRYVVFEGAPDAVATVVALTHPSYGHLNVGRRYYGQLAGDEAEVAMLQNARSQSEQER